MLSRAARLRTRIQAWAASHLPLTRRPPTRALAVDPQDADRIGFGPDAGHQRRSPSLADAPWAREAGWGGCVAFLDEAGAPLREAPAAGQIVPVALSFPFEGRVGAPFWAMFGRPRALHAQGHDPDRQARPAALRLLRCRLVGPVAGCEPLRRDPYALGKAEILEALGPQDLVDGPVSRGALGHSAALAGEVTVRVHGPLWIVRAASGEERHDVLVLWQDGAHLNLLAAMRWSADVDAVAFGNRPLAPDEIAALRRRAGDAGPAGRVAPGFGHRHGDLPAPSLETHPWATGVGFGRPAHFVDAGGEWPPGEAPRIGETARVALSYPFTGGFGESFWVHYEPGSSWWNGYVDDPGDARHIAAMRFVRCRLLPRADLPPQGSYEMLVLEAEILGVLGPDDLLALPPSDRDVDDVFNCLCYDPKAGTDGHLRFVISNFESDVVNWVLLATVGGRVHLLARGEDVWHESAVAFGNRPLTEAETARFAWALTDSPAVVVQA